MRLEKLAERFGLELRGDPDQEIDGVGTLNGARPTQLSFLANKAYLAELEKTGAGAVVVGANFADRCPVNALIAADPYLTYARIARLFEARTTADPEIHESAVIAPTARVGQGVTVGPNVVVGDNTDIGDRCTLHAGVVIGPDCSLGSGCTVHPNVTLMHGVRLGDRVLLHPGCVIGADGFGIAFDKEADGGGRWEKVPQLGGVRIGDDCEIGANSTIDRGAIEDTVLEEDVRVDNLVQIGHNVRIGAHTAIAGCAAVAGSARIGRYCLLAGRASVNGHVSVADSTTVAADSNVMCDITKPGGTWNANLPAQPHRQWQRILARLLRLESLHRRIGKLEKGQGSQSAGEKKKHD